MQHLLPQDLPAHSPHNVSATPIALRGRRWVWLARLVQKVVSENSESASPEVIKQAFEELFKLTSKVCDVVTAIGERSYNESKRKLVSI